MYIYVVDGTIKEIVNDIALRQANDNVNHIYLYMDNFSEAIYNNISVTYRLPNDTIVGPQVVALTSKVTKTIPYNKKRDLKYFKDYQEYEFYDIQIPDGQGSFILIGNVLEHTGLVKCTISFIKDSGVFALNILPFYVEESVVRYTYNINSDEYNYLLQLVLSAQGDKYITLKSDEKQSFDNNTKTFKNKTDENKNLILSLDGAIGYTVSDGTKTIKYGADKIFINTHELLIPDVSGTLATTDFVVANPSGTFTETLSSVVINGVSYKIVSGSDVVANPTLTGTEDTLTGLQVGTTKYKVSYVISGAMTYKGDVLQANLPTIGQVKGDYYRLIDDLPSTYHGQSAVWNGTAWTYSDSNITVDSVLSSTSVNPIQNKAVESALNDKQDKITDTNKLSYTLLSGTPTIPTKTSELTNDSGFLTDHQSLSEYRKAAAQDTIDAGKQDTIDSTHKLDYSLIANTPTIPTAVSQLTNDSNFISDAYNNLSTTRQNAVDSGVTSTKISGYDVHIADTTIHVTSTDKTTWNAKQNALTIMQMNAVDSGITATIVGKLVTTDNKNVANGYAGLDASGKILTTVLPASILNGLKYGGNIDANAINSPSAQLKAHLGITDTTIEVVNLATDDATTTPKKYGWVTLANFFFYASEAFVVGSTSFRVGDALISTGNAWVRIGREDAVTSVNGKTGIVILSADDIGDGTTNLFVQASEKTTWNNKQDAITIGSKLSSSLVSFTTDQNNVFSSGITSTKVGTYDAYATNKQDKVIAGTANDILAYSGTAGTINSLARVTSINSSSTDLQIPTAKAVNGLVTPATITETQEYLIKWYERPKWYEHTVQAKEEDIGRACLLKLNGVDYFVRLVGVDHDTINGSTEKAHTTWEFVNVVSKLDKNGIPVKFNSTDNNSWETSTLRSYLGHEIYNAIQSDVKTLIKLVDKSTYEVSEGDVKVLSDKLFIPSLKELNNTAETGYADEGTQYKYYEGKSQTDMLKRDNKGTIQSMFMRSPDIDGTANVKSLHNSGTINEVSATTEYCIAPMFCI